MNQNANAQKHQSTEAPITIGPYTLSDGLPSDAASGADLARIARLEQLARNLLDPEMFGWAVTGEVRDAARRALGLPPVESRL